MNTPVQLTRTTASAVDALVREQSQGVGGSEVHHVLALEPYGCPEQLRYKKAGARPDKPFNGNKHTRRGLMFEDFIADAYAEETGRKVVRTPGWMQGIARRDQDFSFLLCHSDRQIFNANGIVLANGTLVEPGNPGLLSIKAPGEYALRKLLEEQQMPYGYVAQLQYELAIWKRSWGSYAFGGIVDDEFQIIHFDVVYNEQRAEEIRSLVKLWWTRFQQGETFGKFAEDDPRCQRCPWVTTCQGDGVLRLHQRMLGRTEEGDAIEADPDDKWVELIRLREDRRALLEELTNAKETGLLDQINREIKEKMGERLAVQTLAGKVYYKPQVRFSIQDKPVLETLDVLATNAKVALEGWEEQHNSGATELAVGNVLHLAAMLPELVAEKYTNRSAFRSLRLVPLKKKA